MLFFSPNSRDFVFLGIFTVVFNGSQQGGFFDQVTPRFLPGRLLGNESAFEIVPRIQMAQMAGAAKVCEG